jgi:molybdopterin synthase catalytic subunit
VVRVQHEPIDAQALMRAVRSDADGAVALFVGTVRDHNQGRRVVALAYSAYEEMALREMNRVRSRALTAYAVSEIGVVHRLGELALGEAAVAVAVAAPHRAAAFEACRFVIDTLKTTVPIWKKERFDGGQEWIEGD